jgi:predicted negative regulator of RcsB-dependent stress response
MGVMALDAEQEEQISAFKAWVEEYGNWIVGISLIVVALAAGNWGWRWYVQRDAAAAATLYEQYGEAVTAKDATKARDLAAALLQQHGSSAYASFTALTQARSSLDAGDIAAAKAQLHWVIDKSSSKELVTLARVRLAGLLLDEKAYDEGLALLQSEAPAALAAEVSDRRGDLLLAQGKAAEARSAYAKALEQAGAQNPLRSVIQSKFDALSAAS